MAIIKKKTRRVITKQIKKLIRKHGPEIAAGLVSNIVTGITAATLADDGDDKKSDGKSKKKKKSKS